MTRQFALAIIVMLAAATPAAAQIDRLTFTVGAHAIPLVTRATGTPLGRTLTEGYLTQPILNADLRNHWFDALTTLDLEGATLRRGELDLGAWGEGYVDRRHPHTYVHELMTGVRTGGLVRLSIYGGRGFAPFGSDDPMMRPFVSYPVDHHLAQVLERLLVVGAVRSGPLILEGATFNGDEPVNPTTAPAYNRFGDSWSLRATVAPGSVEVNASYANVKSPEFRAGGGMDQHKLHGAFRYSSAGAHCALWACTRYALVEAARTTDLDRGRALYTFDALLAEAAACHGALGVAVRWERSDRPEEERLLDLFRSARPATDVSVLGVTRWTTWTNAVSLFGLSLWRLEAAPFVEVAHIRADRTTAALFDPVRFYGTNHMWRLSAGLRMGIGHNHGRMGRYGVASESEMLVEPPTAHHASSPVSHCFS